MHIFTCIHRQFSAAVTSKSYMYVSTTHFILAYVCTCVLWVLHTRESVHSLWRDGADMLIVHIQQSKLCSLTTNCSMTTPGERLSSHHLSNVLCAAHVYTCSPPTFLPIVVRHYNKYLLLLRYASNAQFFPKFCWTGSIFSHNHGGGYSQSRSIINFWPKAQTIPLHNQQYIKAHNNGINCYTMLNNYESKHVNSRNFQKAMGMWTRITQAYFHSEIVMRVW